MSCYGDPITLQHVTDEILDGIENYVRNDLGEILNMWDPTRQSIKNVDFYGYCPDISKFKISNGERKLITELKEHVQKIIKEGNIQCFATNPAVDENNSNKQFSVVVDEIFTIENVGRFFTHKKLPSNITVRKAQALQQQLSAKLADIQVSYGVTNKCTIDNIILDRNDGKECCKVICMLCSIRCSISLCTKNKNTYWNFSNFLRHLRHTHKLTPKPNANTTNTIKDTKSSRSKSLKMSP